MVVGVLLVVLLAAITPARTHASPNDFTILSFEADYYLTRDAGKQSQLKVVEKLVAQFPPYDQNHGIERAIPNKYDGHTVKFQLSSIKDDKGKEWAHTTYGSNDNTVLRIGDPDKYVRNIQTYVIEYTLQDVTKNFDSQDEFYWNVNGTDWGQPFGSVTARVHMKSDMAKTYEDRYHCYEGSKGSASKCSVSKEQKDGETILTFKATRMLYAGENMTVVAAFAKDTFAAYQPTTWERLFPLLVGVWFALGGVVLVCMIFILIRAWKRYGKSPEGRGTIVPEYLPPKDMSVLTASVILKKDGKDETAQIIDLAVRHYLKIYETETKGNWFRTKRSYELELIRSLTGLRKEERGLIELIFGKSPSVGQRITVEALKSKLHQKAATLQKGTEAQAIADGYLADMAVSRKRYYWIGGLLLGGGALLLSVGTAIAGVITLIVVSSFHPLAKKGVERREYLQGLEMYMKLAEAERLRVLQSPSGAAKTTIDPTSKKQLVKLYERLLPYAIIFGIEKDWAKVFAPLYDKQPDWYSGNWAAFNAGAFAASLGNFTTISNSTFTPPNNSSSSGFGGGFSGGGGGGGGGGGW
jgi:hypothetical protein